MLIRGYLIAVKLNSGRCLSCLHEPIGVDQWCQTPVLKGRSVFNASGRDGPVLFLDFRPTSALNHLHDLSFTATFRDINSS